MGFVWLEVDHPGTRDVKDALRSRITDAILQQASVFDASISRNAVNNTAAAAAAAPETDGGTSYTSTRTTTDPVNKKRRSVLFASYEKRRESDDQPVPSRSS